MRHIGPAIALILSALCVAAQPHPAAALDVEENRQFGDTARQATVTVLSTTDAEIFAPVIEGFRESRPEIAVRYIVASSKAVEQAVREGDGRYDLVISSAMDLQMKLANDGHAAAHVPAAGINVPDHASWRTMLYAFAEEPVVVAVSKRGLGNRPLPRTRRELVDLLRDNPELFRGRIGTYDPVTSGAGYLFATQDARQSDAFWRLAEVMGRLDVRLFCCSSEMIDGLRDGSLLIAYNLLGSYASSGLDPDGDIALLEFEDFTNALLRTAFVPAQARNPVLGGALLDFLLSPSGQRLIATEAGLPAISSGIMAARPHLRPIRLDPGLLVYLDGTKKRKFLGEWTAAVIQP